MGNTKRQGYRYTNLLDIPKVLPNLYVCIFIPECHF
jgi:hypothetical protein